MQQGDFNSRRVLTLFWSERSACTPIKGTLGRGASGQPLRLDYGCLCPKRMQCCESKRSHAFFTEKQCDVLEARIPTSEEAQAPDPGNGPVSASSAIGLHWIIHPRLAHARLLSLHDSLVAVMGTTPGQVCASSLLLPLLSSSSQDVHIPTRRAAKTVDLFVRNK